MLRCLGNNGIQPARGGRTTRRSPGATLQRLCVPSSVHTTSMRSISRGMSSHIITKMLTNNTTLAFRQATSVLVPVEEAVAAFQVQRAQPRPIELQEERTLPWHIR